MSVKALSAGEEELALHLGIYKIPFVREFRFYPPRRWRADFAVIESRLLIEVDGGTWSGGRHSRGKGYEEDARKLNTAAVLGFKILRFTPAMITSGEAIDTIVKAIAAGC